MCVNRKRSPERYSSPAKSSKSQPFGITRTSPAGSKARTSSAIGSETATTASAERATSRTTCCSAFSFACTARELKRTSALPTTESRRSAIHGIPVRRLTAAPIRFIEFGGLVVITASIASRLTSRTAAGTAVGSQVTLASGSSARR